MLDKLVTYENEFGKTVSDWEINCDYEDCSSCSYADGLNRKDAKDYLDSLYSATALTKAEVSRKWIFVGNSNVCYCSEECKLAATGVFTDKQWDNIRSI